MNREYCNASGCSDPTAYHAVKNIQQDDVENVNKLIKRLKDLISESGFVLINRIELKSQKSGTIFK